MSAAEEYGEKCCKSRNVAIIKTKVSVSTEGVMSTFGRVIISGK